MTLRLFESHHRPCPFGGMFAQVILVLTVFALGGCMEERITRDTWGEFRESKWNDNNRRPRPITVRDPATTPMGAEGWGILLQTFEGQHRYRAAATLITELRRNANVPDLWQREQDQKVYVYRGLYARGSSPEAQQDLRHMRTVQIDGTRPFAAVEVVPISGAAQSAGAYDLSQYSGMYSLQVAAFDAAGGEKFRLAAETYAAQIRAGGDEAYHYHGPHRSMVCVGLFTDDDIHYGETGGFSPQIRELQKRFPHNLVNGMTIVEKHEGQVIGEQPSAVVRIP